MRYARRPLPSPGLDEFIIISSLWIICTCSTALDTAPTIYYPPLILKLKKHQAKLPNKQPDTGLEQESNGKRWQTRKRKEVLMATTRSVRRIHPLYASGKSAIDTDNHISFHLLFVVLFPFATLPLGQNDYRRKWDKEEYLAKSKAQDAAAQEYAQAAQAAQAAGKKPPPRPRAGDANLGPKPTKALEARDEDLGIEKNLGKSMLVAAGGKGPGAGFYVSDSISSGESQVASWERVKE